MSLQIILRTDRTEIVRTPREVRQDALISRTDHEQDAVTGKLRHAIDIREDAQISFVPVRHQIGAPVGSIAVFRQQQVEVSSMVERAMFVRIEVAQELQNGTSLEEFFFPLDPVGRSLFGSGTGVLRGL